jgi:hypothetical protein
VPRGLVQVLLLVLLACLLACFCSSPSPSLVLVLAWFSPPLLTAACLASTWQVHDQPSLVPVSSGRCWQRGCNTCSTFALACTLHLRPVPLQPLKSVKQTRDMLTRERESGSFTREGVLLPGGECLTARQ